MEKRYSSWRRKREGQEPIVPLAAFWKWAAREKRAIGEGNKDPS
jgi:hypothetical protein